MIYARSNNPSLKYQRFEPLLGRKDIGIVFLVCVKNSVPLNLNYRHHI